MTDLIGKTGMASHGGAEHLHGKIKIPVKTGLAEKRMIELEFGRSVMEILAVMASEFGCHVEELILVREGEEGPLTEAIIVDAEYPHKRRHHVHRAGDVKVTVYYQAGSLSQSFRRYASVEDVLRWAIGAYHIDPAVATECALALHGHDQKEELPGAEHIGHLAGPHHELTLELVRGVIANGSRL